MNLDDLKVIRLTPDYIVKPFDCGDLDLNEFLLKESENYQKQLIATTYLIERKETTVAFYSLLNDKVSIADTPSKSSWRKYFRDTFPQGKRFFSYPAVKIGRLAVDLNYQSKGLGTFIMDSIKGNLIENPKTGCKYITVDAYRQSLNYYEKNGFKYMTSSDEKEDTRLMYFDLITLSEIT